MTWVEAAQVHGNAYAAMEPAEDRPDDGSGVCLSRKGNRRPQWSRPRIGRMTRQRLRHRDRGGRAAMEPAEDRPDDPPRHVPAYPGSGSRNGAGRGSAG